MAKVKTSHRCADCGYTTAKWVGRCPDCGAWGSLVEAAPVPTGAARGAVAAVAAPTSPATPITAVAGERAGHRPTGIGELDRVLGGGIVPGSVVLLAGEPGVGKSTLLLEVAHRWARTGQGAALYITGEESVGQVRMRAERTGALHEDLLLAAETDLHTVLGHIDQSAPGLVIVDSVQTMLAPGVDGVTGGTTQVRAVTSAVTAVAKSRGIPVLLVGHVTKDGAIAGPRTLEHMVDVVLHFEGEKTSTLRMLRGVKNRFGSADEVGCFEQSEGGIVEVTDPSGLFLHHRTTPVAGTAVTVTMDGKRPLLGEVQALVAPSTTPSPRRAVSGLDSARVAMILAVLERRCGIRLSDRDVYVATVGGMRVYEPSADLAIAMAIASAQTDQAPPEDLVVVGEVGLAGEVRRVAGVARRTAEAARLGFRGAVVPEDSGRPPEGMRAVAAGDVGRALQLLGRSLDGATVVPLRRKSR